MSHGEWYGLDELGRGAASRLDTPAPADAETPITARVRTARRQAARGEPAPMRAATREAAPSAWEERLRASEEKLDALLAAARALGDSMTAHAACEEERLAALDEIKGGVGALADRFDARIAKTDYEETTLKRLSGELDRHRDNLYRKIVEPLINEVIDVHQDMSATVASYQRTAEADPEELAARMRRDLDEFRLMLGDILRNWNVETWWPEPGDALEPLRCRAVRAVPTDDEARHRTVAETVASGYALEGKVLRPAQVVAYAFRPKPEAKAASASADREASEAPAGAPLEAEAVPANADREAGAAPAGATLAGSDPEVDAAADGAVLSEAPAAPDAPHPASSADPSGSPRPAPPAPPAPPSPRASEAGGRQQSA